MRKTKWQKLFSNIEHGRRLIEFVNICLNNKNNRLQYEDIAKQLEVDIVSVHRYRNQLNCLGITVHSYKKSGVLINTDTLTSETVLCFVKLYQGYILIDESLVRAEKFTDLIHSSSVDSNNLRSVVDMLKATVESQHVVIPNHTSKI